jgi:uncharacterized membrane protein YkoI
VIAFIHRIGLALALGVFVLVAAQADEKIPLNKVPKKVTKAVKSRFPGSKLLGAETEKENGKTRYELAVEHKGQKYEAIVTPRGKIVEIEKTIAVADLPEAVTKTLGEKYPKATYPMAEEVYKIKAGKEKMVYYEVVVVTGGKKKEVLIKANGQIVTKGAKGKAKE